MSSLASTLSSKVLGWRDILKTLVLGIVAVIFLTGISYSLPDWLAWIPRWLSYPIFLLIWFAIISIPVQAFAYAIDRMEFAGGSAMAAIDIRSAATPIIALSPMPDAFSIHDINPVDKEIPEIEGKWLSITEDEKILQQYANYLDERRNTINSEVRSAINRFNKDRLALIDHQKSVIRRAFQARRLVERFKDLPKILLSTATLPRIEQLSIPSAPAFLNAQQYAKKYAAIPKNAGFALSRLAQINGVGLNQGNAIALALGAAALAIRAKSMISRSLRALEDARGKVDQLAAEARTTVELLGKAHIELVAASKRMKEVAEEIDALALDVSELPQRTTKIDGLALEQQERLKSLWYWIASAKRISHAQV